MVHHNENIKILDASVIHQLRSSLVISTLPQCLKELIRNAIDAKATQIDIMIDIENFNLQVNDNGNGIQDMSKIGQRYVTSKCHTLSDMSQLKTFGFRGEALAAITNEAKVYIISRHKSSLETFIGFWKNGDCISSSKHTRKNQPGTSVLIRDLFYKFPVRRRHLSSNTNPYQYDVVMIESVKRLIISFALCFQDISFTLVDSTRNTKILNIKKSNNSIDLFRQLFGQELSQYTKCAELHEDNIQVNGFFSTSGYPNKTHQYIYVNNFLVPNHNRLYKEVSTLFASSKFSSAFIPTESATKTSKSKASISVRKYPIFLIKFECINWSYYEINMYLDILSEFSSFDIILSLLKKFTLKFLYQSQLLNTTTKPVNDRKVSVKKRPHPIESPYMTHSSTSSNSTFTSKSNSTNNEASSKYVTWWDPNSKRTFIIDRTTGNSSLSTPTSRISHTHQNRVDRSHLKRVKSNHFGALSNTAQQYENRSSSVQHIPLKLSKEDLQDSKVLGQVDNKYIAIKRRKDDGNSLIIMIDQHAADERVKLERMLQPSLMVSNNLEPNICLILDSHLDYNTVTADRTLKYLKIWGIHISTSLGISNNNATSDFFINDNRTTNNNATADADYFYMKSVNTSPHLFERKDTRRINFIPKHLQNTRHLHKIYVTQLPGDIIDRCVLNHSLLKNVIIEYAHWITKQLDDTVLRKTCPKGIVEILRSKACRSAVMFNDKLSLNDCEKLVKQLSRCNYPFQCAHGRPSAVPIYVNLSCINTHKRDINWNRLQF